MGASLASVVRSTRDALAEAGVQSPDADAVTLLALTLGTSVGECRTAVARGDELSDSFDELAFDALVARRVAREPLQHITGHAAFRGLDLEVGQGVFIPRPETELVAGCAIETAATLALTRATNATVTVVDLCAGSGAIGISVASEVPASVVTMVELSADAYRFLERNVAAQPEGVRARITILKGDARTALADRAGFVDIAVANPPYIPPGAKPREPEVALHDPGVALYGLGADGLEVPRGIVAAAGRLVRPGGTFVMEHADEQGASVRELMELTKAWIDIRTMQDLAGRDRFAVATRA